MSSAAWYTCSGQLTFQRINTKSESSGWKTKPSVLKVRAYGRNAENLLWCEARGHRREGARH